MEKRAEGLPQFSCQYPLAELWSSWSPTQSNHGIVSSWTFAPGKPRPCLFHGCRLYRDQAFTSINDYLLSLSEIAKLQERRYGSCVVGLMWHSSWQGDRVLAWWCLLSSISSRATLSPKNEVEVEIRVECNSCPRAKSARRRKFWFFGFSYVSCEGRNCQQMTSMCIGKLQVMRCSISFVRTAWPPVVLINVAAFLPSQETLVRCRTEPPPIRFAADLAFLINPLERLGQSGGYFTRLSTSAWQTWQQ